MEQNNQNVTPVEASSEKSKNPLVIIGLIYALVVVALITAIIVVRVARGSNSSKPTPELAESVCKKYGGELETITTSDLSSADNGYNDYLAVGYSCSGEKGKAAFMMNGTQYTIMFLKDDKKDEYWAELRKTVAETEPYEDMSGYSVLENSDNFIKVYMTIAGLVRGYTVAYDNAVAMVYTQSDSAAEDILRDLGFPEGAKVDTAGSNKGTDGGDNSGGMRAAQRDAQRRDDYSMLVTAVNSYLASNNGEIEGITNKGDLDATRWMNDDGEDPNGDPYVLKAYTYDTWSGLNNRMPSGDEMSEVFIVTQANCNGEDSSGDPFPSQDTSKRAFAVYGYLEDGYFCQASGSNS